VYPLLLHIFGRDQTTENLSATLQILCDLESFLVRRLVCGLTTKNYNRLFLDLLHDVVSTEETPESTVREGLLSVTGDSTRWPDDDEFRSAWMTRNIYSLSKRKVSLVLGALDVRLQKRMTEAYTLVYQNLTIEHLLPQSWEEHWPLDPELPEDAARHQRVVTLHTMGNLTLLTTALNPSVSNGPWGEKRQKILAHSALNLNRDLPLTWDEARIQARSELLFDTAAMEWPYPKS
jgi:hypothetical protein